MNIKIALIALTALSAAHGAEAKAPAGVQLDVTKDPAGADALVVGTVEINAPPAKVWKLLTDCAAIRRMTPSTRVCSITGRDPAGRWDVREQVIKVPLEPDMRTVLRSELSPERQITFRQVEGDMKLMEGEWRLEALNGGAATRVSYRLRLTPACGAPMLVRSFLRRESAQGLANLRTESEKS